jgi:3',5'-cyclic AMP phosphodiesterase CpdA
MRRIAHISDLHFGCTGPAVAEGLVMELNEDKSDLIIISGDFTMAARRGEYVEARAFLQKLSPPWIGVPGNHDISPYHLMQRFLRPFARYRRFIAADTEPVFQDAEIGVVCLNTVRTWAPERDWSQGKISRRQIVKAEARLAAMPPDLFKIVVGHHPFMPPPWDEEARLVGCAAKALATFQRCGVGLTLAGHLHRYYARFAEPGGTGSERVELDAGGTRSCKGQLLAVQAGSATSTRLRGNEKNAYNRITIEDGCAFVTVRIWNGRHWEDARG